MGFYIRKSVRVGPLRFNLSKSGIGVSTGVPGLRVGSGPRGTYIHMGRGGLYYRQTLSSPTSQRQGSDRPSVHVPVENPQTHGPMNAIGSGCVSEMVDTNSAAILSEIELRRKRIVWWPFMLVVSLILVLLLLASEMTIWLTMPCAITLLFATLFLHQYDQLNKSLVLMYELDGPSLDSYKELFAAVNDISSCGAVWHVTARGDVYDPKYHAGAGYLISRKRLSIGYRNPPYVKTNLSVPVLPFGKHTMYLLPDRILVYGPNGVGAVEYGVLSLSSKPTRFIEDGMVPRDATVVDHTWRYVNKNGGPDRRFSNNRQIPICEYEELQISSSSGVHEIIQLSRLGISNRFESAISSVIDEIRNAEAAERERKRLEDQSRQQSLKETSALVTEEVTRDSTEIPTPEMMHAALFDALCCIMIADGRASTSEKSAIREIMSKVQPGWTDDECNSRMTSFISAVQNQGYASIVRRTISQLSIFKQVGREGVLLKCIDIVATADATFSQREHDLRDQIRKSMGVSTSSDTERNAAPDSKSQPN